MGMEMVDNVVTREKLEGKRSRERPKQMMLCSLLSWYEGASVSGMLDSTRDRRLWSDIIANTTCRVL